MSPVYEAPTPEAEDLREYLLDMLAQLAKMAEVCNEPGIAMVLNTIVASRGVKGNRDGGADVSPAPSTN